MTAKMIKIATDFSRFPAGRFYSDGPYSGEKFREELLLPMFSESGEQERIEINLDRTRGYGSSFLEEAFGGMVRQLKPQSLQNILQKITFISNDDDTLIPEIREYMNEAFDACHHS